MNKQSEEKFLETLDICQSFINFKYRPTNLTYQAIELFCELGKNPSELLALCKKYSSLIQETCKTLDEYGTSIDNLRIDCPLGFGAKDHCSFLSFFLNLYNHKFQYFTGNFTTPEEIAELFKEWKGIDLTTFIETQATVRL